MIGDDDDDAVVIDLEEDVVSGESDKSRLDVEEISNVVSDKVSSVGSAVSDKVSSVGNTVSTGVTVSCLVSTGKKLESPNL